MTIEYLKNNNLIVLECISGSKAYNLANAKSDTDIRGVFILPKAHYYGLDYIEQVSDDSNDTVYFELGKFVRLLLKNNPNILELLATPQELVLHKDPLMNDFKQELFLSKICKNTFAGYAMSQVKKARGLNKKIVNPMPGKRKSVLEFCHIQYQNGSIPLSDWLEKNEFRQENCGLVNIPNMKDLYGLYHSIRYNYSGIIKSPNADEIALSSIPKGEKQLTLLYFNKNGYSVYCKEYKQYREWLDKRNPDRYQNNIEHGKNYDSKNMMHTFRLLHMAEEIAQTGVIQLQRTTDREFLLKIKKGAFSYEELVDLANKKIENINRLFENANLPAKPDYDVISNLLFKTRERFYAKNE